MKQLDFSFYNTCELEEPELSEAEDNARWQEEKIYRLFKIFKTGTPSEVMRRYEQRWPAVPITSIRRAMTNLTKAGKLVKTDVMQTGIYGKPEHQWEII